ncbi:MAG: hypothetical protein Q7S92_02680 [Candidatus Diapherotrites archaeon]|nr:hypothetical protein [Candidatus Diapherotrites archaeon]
MQEDDLLIQSIKKLRSLNVSDQEILLNLKELGVDEPKARTLLAQSKQTQNELLKETANLSETESEENVLLDEVMEDKTQVQSIKPIPEATQISKLWEKGILVTITQNLEEMQRLKKDIGLVVDSKVKESMEKERKKMQTLLDSQRILLGEKVNVELQGKEKEITEIINSKIQELTELAKEIQANLQDIERLKIGQQQVLKEFEVKKQELIQTKNKMVIEMNSELIKEKSSAEEILNQLKEKLGEIDNRVDKSLELESKIVEGLVADAEDQITQLKDEKKSELSADIEAELEKLEVIRKKIDPDKLQEKIKQLDLFKKQIEQAFTGKEQEIELFKQQLQVKSMEAAKEAAQEKVSESAAIVRKEMDVEGFKTQMKGLEEFRKQFVNALQENTDQFNEKLTMFNESTVQMMKEYDSRVKKIDSKIEELDTFAKNFAQELGLVLDELIKKEKNKKK